MIREILRLGNPLLYEKSEAVSPSEMKEVKLIIQDLHDTMMEFRRIYRAGRAIAAPQIGVMKRILYMHVDRPLALINPVLTPLGEEMMKVMDDCMCFPELLVEVERYKRCRIDYLDEEGQARSMELEGDLSELLQHEYDHLDGILATMRAASPKAFHWKHSPLKKEEV